jgi:hypothetical protein
MNCRCACAALARVDAAANAFKDDDAGEEQRIDADVIDARRGADEAMCLVIAARQACHAAMALQRLVLLLVRRASGVCG